MHETFGDSAFFTHGVIKCNRCTWVESPEHARILAEERAAFERHSDKGYTAVELIYRVAQDLTFAEAR
jgi:hypothetical protein